ncbi:hypothetical protein ALC57_15133 [Trachymyrmex cornetzi]|uniref:SWIM-type domain-containing protein n=1 Tax=Trachymyrmex cornetzi TaxID=471704 RepID=A0A151IXA5_9HYME|nr:hypothetical protein ALC57_15133 [Trachymyrmex cornetzi]
MINTLLNNGYPLDFLFNTINNRIKSLSHNNKLKQTNHKDLINSNIKIYCTLPYVKNLTEKFQNVYRNYNLNIAYKPINSLNKFIKTGKDKLDKMDNNNVVYKINCYNCDCSYVGQAKRKLKTRIKEHKADIRKSNNHSVVSLHQLQYGHQIDWENINILDFLFIVIHYACECANGRRTIGCCSHIAAIIYYLSYARYLSKIFKPAEILSDIFKKIIPFQSLKVIMTMIKN